MKLLPNLLTGVDVLQTNVNTQNVEINQIHFDSRKVCKNDVFVAVRGTITDGHNYINKAVELGAVAIVAETMPDNLPANIICITTSNSAVALGIMASNFYDNPSSKLKLVAITGTNGKTTTVTLLYNLFKKLGYKTGLFSTICNIIDNQKIEATHTTPDPLMLNQLLAQMVAQGCDYCFMEASSHAIHQHRVAGLQFAGGIFSNITQDHLDYHVTFAEYLKAKKMFFDNLPPTAFAITNADDKNGGVMVQNTKASIFTYGLKNMANYHAKVIEKSADGMLIAFNQTEIWTRFIGDFNASNLLAVYAAAMCLGQNSYEVLTALSSLKPVNGRFQTIMSKSGVTAVVDYAHTPDALQNVLLTLNNLALNNNKIITVFGAGGNRDKTKRPIMGSIAAKLSSKVIVTSDNPRNEKPHDIINDIMAGILPPFNKKTVCIADRAEAIKTACLMAGPGDFILVAGKGHENYQEIDGVKYHFDDSEIINTIFENE